MFRIGEFSKLTQVSVRMLRYYDDAGLLKPERTDPQTGYRMYSAAQIPVLNRIIYLRDSGFGVAEIMEAVNSGDDKFIIRQLDKKYGEITGRIEEEQMRLERIKLAREELSYGGRMHYNVSIKSIPPCSVLSLRKVIPTYYAEGELWEELSVFAKSHKITVSEETFSIYHDTEYKERDVDVEICAPVDKPGRGTGAFSFRTVEEVPYMACTMVYGAFSNIAGAYAALAEWLQQNRLYRMTGQSRQIVHRGPWNEEIEEKYLTEIQIPCLTLTRCQGPE
ncbi:MerR family transcriptional regulator [[Clostridium] hylemonae]|uniref:Transcriptional regulator, effector binding domain protein n=1 Tax=[Clostridium] hylemonae DSM 15053 TaxID=553973 RepID=C0BWW0_9FIRM|nr:effector binding domain-containing protein [[Clostridium] hylemonae]EEG75558.1 transcriptional regulator, effector binding domain protein [[Clostridium] hylemonae DSM 15053]QEK17919.1 Multidrug-efflux transporter 1 regulator [[Clostridium] hylemonae DSM 15053]